MLATFSGTVGGQLTQVLLYLQPTVFRRITPHLTQKNHRISTKVMFEIKGNNYNEKGKTRTSANDKERLQQIMRFACR
jgi:hypothetical protein